MTIQPRDENGRLVGVNCPDVNCGGRLTHEIEITPWGPARHTWRCDGLTYDRRDDPLHACGRFISGPIVQQRAA